MTSFDTALYAACAQALAPAPTNSAEIPAWVARVGSLYDQLVAQKSRLADRADLIARIEAPKETRERGFGIVTGTLTDVHQEHGRAVLTVDSDMGSGEYGPDVFRTEWLDDGGAELAATARELMGQRVRVWKYAEPHSKKPGTTVRMAAKIEAAGAKPTEQTEPKVVQQPTPVTPESTVETPTVTPPVADSDPTAPDTDLYAMDGTTTIDELRNFQPESIRELRQWATDYLGFEQDRVTQIAQRILKATSGKERTPAELRTVWRALLAHYTSTLQHAA